jgi:integrase
MPRNQKKDYSEGPIWDEKVKRWLAEVVYPDDTRGRRRFRRQRDAQIWWAAQRKAIEDGSWEALANPNRVSLGDAIAQYREYSKAHHRSFSTYIENGLTVLGEALGPKTPLKDVTTANIEQMKLQRLENGRVAKSTVDKNVALAKSFFNWCIHQGLTTANPVKKVKLFHEDNERVRFLDPEAEYPRLLAEARNGPWYLEPIIVLDVNTGLRRRNILYVRWDQVDFKRRIIRIESRTKSGRPHNLPLNDTAFQKLKEVHQKTGSYRYAFVHLEGKFEGQPITDIKNAFNGAVDRAKIQNFRFHDLRHTFCSWLAIRGVPLTAIQKLAGHASIKMTLRYAHLSPRYLADEVKALDLVQQNGRPQTQSDAEQASPSEMDQSEKESTEQDSGEDSTPAPTLRVRRSRRSQKAVKAGKPGQPMHGIGKK